MRNKEEVLNKYFFSQLNEFENQIMNRLTTPQYSYSLNIIKKTEAGNTFNTQKIFAWPTTDGYNIDNGGSSFDYYLTNWLDASKQLDEYKTDLIARRFITSSIVEFDTEGDGTDIYGRKINKLLRINKLDDNVSLTQFLIPSSLKINIYINYIYYIKCLCLV